jgi:hypothetical protein
MNDLEFDASDGWVCKHEAAQFGGIDDQRCSFETRALVEFELLDWMIR